MNTEKIITNFYATREEDKRFESKHGEVEFIITRKYINDYLKKGDRILEIGCGTGKYALYYARQGYRVDAIELSQAHLEVLWQNTLDTDDICAVQGNALDLSDYADETFAITLLLGPMYHLFTDKDKIRCLREAERVTQSGGVIFVAYCQFDAAMVQTGFMRGMYTALVNNRLLDEDTWLPISNPDGIFELYRQEKIDWLNTHVDVQRLHYVGTDMFSHYYAAQIDAMDEVLYEKYLAYTFSICENPSLVGISNHTLDILRKGMSA